MSDFTKGRLSIVKEMMQWIASELAKHPAGSGVDEHAKKLISGVRKAHKRTFQKLLEKEQKTLNHETNNSKS